MVEEAAGTSMYETKREATTKLIEKKDAKVRETNALLHEEVEPKLEKLRKERAAHLEFQKICRDIEYLTRIYVSFKWLKQSEALNLIKENIRRLTKQIDEAKNNILENSCKREQITEQINLLQTKIENDSSTALKLITEQLEAELKQEAKLSGQLRACHDEINQEKKKLSILLNNITEDNKTLKNKELEMAKSKHLFQDLKDSEIRDMLAYETAQKKFEVVSQGLSTNDDGHASSLQDQLISTYFFINVYV